LADYQAVLQTINFSSSSHNPTNFGSDVARTLTWVVNDGAASNPLSAAQTTTLSITPINDAPTLSNVASTVSYTESTGPMFLSPSVTVTDPDSLTLTSATVAITGGRFAGADDNMVEAAVLPGITWGYDKATETFTLTGTGTLSDYITELRFITFGSGENPTNFGSNPTRTLIWTLNDGGGTLNGGVQVSTPVTTTINLTSINDAPTLANVANPLFFTEEGGAVTLSSSVTVTDPDDVNLSSATVRIVGGTFANDGDVL